MDKPGLYVIIFYFSYYITNLISILYMNYVFDFVLIEKNSRRGYLSYKLKSQQVEYRLYKQNRSI